MSATACSVAIYPAFRLLFPNQVIRADDLARAIVDVAVHDTSEPGHSVLENRDIRAVAAWARPEPRKCLRYKYLVASKVRVTSAHGEALVLPPLYIHQHHREEP